jgi:hypothetical protein
VDMKGRNAQDRFHSGRGNWRALKQTRKTQLPRWNPVTRRSDQSSYAKPDACSLEVLENLDLCQEMAAHRRACVRTLCQRMWQST